MTVLWAPSFYKIILRIKICGKWGTDWKRLCRSCAQTLPACKGSIRLMGTSCQARMSSQCPYILVGFTSRASDTIPTCKHSCCQHQALHSAKLLPSPLQRAATYPRWQVFQKWSAFPQHLPLIKFHTSRLNWKKKESWRSFVNKIGWHFVLHLG